MRQNRNTYELRGRNRAGKLIKIYQNIWGNWCGMIGQGKVELFFGTDQAEQARAWFDQQMKVQKETLYRHTDGSRKLWKSL
jgi:hypothetical protein